MNEVRRILATDCGSTTTKAILIERTGEGYRLIARGEAPTTVEAPFEVSGQTIVDMMALDLVIGSGGVLSHAPRRSQAALMLLDACQPEGFTQQFGGHRYCRAEILQALPRHQLLVEAGGIYGLRKTFHQKHATDFSPQLMTEHLSADFSQRMTGQS